MTAPFENKDAAKLWNAYFAEFDELAKPLASEGAELRKDLENHVLDSLFERCTGNGNLETRLEEAFQRLGTPIEYLRPLLAEHHLLEAQRNFNPTVIGRGLALSIRSATGQVFKAACFAFGYLFIASFLLIALSKPFWPEYVGLFFLTDGSISFGIVTEPDDAQEVLGWWTIPLTLVLAGSIYVMLTKGLSILTHRA